MSVRAQPSALQRDKYVDTELGAFLSAPEKCLTTHPAEPHCMWTSLTKQTPTSLNALGKLDGAAAHSPSGNSTRSSCDLADY